MDTQTDSATHYAALGPDAVLDAVDSAGFESDGRLQALNSYENRVYLVGLGDGGSVVAKFYRPERWSDAAILEEHRYTQALRDHELPVAAPLADAQGRTLLTHAGYRFAVYPRVPGRAPELDRAEPLKQIGRLLARIHGIGALAPFASRPALSIREFGEDPVAFLLDGWIPAHLHEAYRTVAADLLIGIRRAFAEAGDVGTLRLQGDCHPGNVLWNVDGPWLVDFDDARQGPAIQDLWMFLSGDRDYMQARLNDLLEGYCAFRDFDARELHLIEALRSLRMLHHAAWLARRWQDPAFPRAFPWFNTMTFWQDHVLSLREQMSLMQEPPLSM